MRRKVAAFLLLLVVLLACYISEEERIRQTLNRREEAFQKKDLALYLSCISRDYQDKEEGFRQLQERIESYFKTFDRIQYSNWDRSIHMEADSARVIQQFYLEVERQEKKNSYSGKESIFLKKEGRQWRIIKGL